MDNYFVFNGVSSLDMGLQIERYPVIPKPKKRITPISIPGRNGDLHIADGSFENVTIRYKVWWKNTKQDDYNTGAHARKISDWLCCAPVGARLEDTYNPGSFRTATFIGGAEIEDVMGRLGRAVLEFSCSPQNWLGGTHSEGVTFTNKLTDIDGLLTNPTPYPTKPLIKIIGSIGGRLDIGDSGMTIRFPGMDTHEFWLDCEEMEAWEVVDGQEVPSNTWIDNMDFIQILPGVNEVKFPSSFDSVTIWTRAYYL